MSETDVRTHTPADESPGQTIVQIDRSPERIIVDGITPEAADELRRHVEEASGGGNRFMWFMFGFVAALVAGVVAAGTFLVVSDEDDDGNIDLEVPNVEVSVDP